MSLDAVREGKIKVPFRLMLYGPEKAGKSTFAAGAPSPIWLGADSGTEHLNIKRLPSPETFRDVMEGLDEVATRGRSLGFETLVVDPIGWIEPMMVLDITGDAQVNLAKWGGGHGAGYIALGDRYRMLINGTERVWKAGLNVILIAHATVKMFNDPEGPGYERYELAVDKRGAGPLKQWVDAILFAKQEAFGKVDDQKRAKAYGSAAHMLHTKWSPAYDAGNRYTLPETMPLSWDAFASALAKGEIEAAALREQIEGGLRELADPEIEKKVRGYLADPRYDVAEIANSVAAKVGEKRAKEQPKAEG
jgi:hypothetical protein